MALKFSSGTVKRMAGLLQASLTATTIALVDGGASADSITDSGSGLVSAGFTVGGQIIINGATDSDDDVRAAILSVAAGTIEVPTGTFTTGETAGASITLRQYYPGSLAMIFHDAVLDIYSGTRPTHANDAEGSATKLASFNGIRWSDAVWDSDELEAYINLYAAAAITATASAGGTATWFRLRGGGVTTTGASTTAPRIDGTIGTGTGDMPVGSQTVDNGATQTISSIKIAIPAE